jgi:hypothetical protein
VQPLGRKPAPDNAARFAGRRFDFRREDLGARPGYEAPKVSAADRAYLAERYPRGVRFTRAGYPVFTPYAVERVRVDNLTGDLADDIELANEAAGLPAKPKGYSWHHVEDGRTMELVETRLHRNVRHVGGSAGLPDVRDAIAPGGVFTPFEGRLALGGGAVGGLVGPAGAEAGEP